MSESSWDCANQIIGLRKLVREIRGLTFLFFSSQASQEIRSTYFSKKDLQLLLFSLSRYIWFLVNGWCLLFPFSIETKQTIGICKAMRVKPLQSLSGRQREAFWNITGCENSSALCRAPQGALAVDTHLSAMLHCPENFCSSCTPLPVTSYFSALLWSYCFWRPMFGKCGLNWKKKIPKINSVSSSVRV